MSLPGRLLSVDGIRVFVHRSGAPAAGRAPVVVIHGWFTSHWEHRHTIAALAAAGHEVLAVDLPGFGESDRPSVMSYRYDASAFADTIVAVLDTLAVDRASFVAHSMGAAASLVAAARRPERVDRLVLVNPSVYPVRLPPEARILLAPVAGPWVFRAACTRATIRYFMRRDLYRDAAHATDEWVDYLYERVFRPGGVEAAQAALRLVADPSAAAQSARAVRAPTLIAWGEEDRLCPSSWARRLSGELPGSEVRIIPACGHSPSLERPAELAKTILPFLGAREGTEWRAA